MLCCSWLFREMQSNFSKFCLVFWRTIWLLWSHGCTGARDQHLHVASARTGIVTKLNAVLTQFPLVFLWKDIFGVLGLQVNVSLAQGMGTTKNPFWPPKYFSWCEIFWNLLVSSFQEAFLMEKSNASLASKYFSALGCCSTLPVPASACLRGWIGSLNRLRLLSLLIVLYFSMLTLYEGCWFHAMYSLHESWKMFICFN